MKQITMQWLTWEHPHTNVFIELYERKKSLKTGKTLQKEKREKLLENKSRKG